MPGVAGPRNRRRTGDADATARCGSSYLEAGWTELTDPQNAVELAIVLEELGRATDPTPFLATLSQYAPLAGERFDRRQGRHRDL